MLKQDTQRAAIRQTIKQRRQTLSEQQQQTAAQLLCQQVMSSGLLQQANTVAIYIDNKGEIATNILIKLMWGLGKKVYLPIIHPFSNNCLLFSRYNASTELVANRFNILEPKLNVTELCPLSQLDIVFTPLVAFDENLNRLGMGGGFYDRTLASLASLNNPPMVVGLAHECQKVSQVPADVWDIPINYVVTPENIYR